MAKTLETGTPDQTPDDTDESPEERVSRELDELLQQLRITLPGVQVLFAFLLTVPFTNRFHLIDGPARDVFFLAFMATALAAALLLAPVAYARIQFRRFDKERLLRFGTAVTIAGLSLLGIALSASSYVVTQVIFSNAAAAAVAAGLAIVFALLWFVVPIVARMQGRSAAPPLPGNSVLDR